jgi:hypothetical protein
LLEKAGNIGVALGKVSGGLCSIDIDDDEWVEPFLKLNPALKDTHRTKGVRGCNFWARITGDCPKTFFLKVGDEKIGEFRSTGSQTIIKGTHPTGCEYQTLNKAKPVCLAYDELKWPESDKKQEQQEPSSVSLNSKSSILHPLFYITMTPLPYPPVPSPSWNLSKAEKPLRLPLSALIPRWSIYIVTWLKVALEPS